MVNRQSRAVTTLRRILKSPGAKKAMAAKLGVAPSMVSMLAAGQRVPGLDLALRLQKETGIEPAAWKAASR